MRERLHRLTFAVVLGLAAVALLPAPAHGQEEEEARRRARIQEVLERRRRIEQGDTTLLPPSDLVVPQEPAAAPDAQQAAEDTRVTEPADRGGPPARQEPDSLMRALGELPGYTSTRYTGSAASFSADSGAVQLIGPATIERAGQNIAADSLLTFDRVSGVVCGYGNPVLSGEGNPISSDQICYDTELRMGMALGARTEFAQGATWYVHGERVFTHGSEVIYSAGTEFTTCDLEVPHYHFRAARFKMVNEEILVARDVTLHFGGVPVFWLPFLVQNLTQGRRSGLLTPSLGLSDVVQTSTGHTREVRNLGFFWAINDYTGTEVAMDWRSSEWIALRGRFDYRWTRQFLQGYVNAQQYFREGGSREMTLRADNGWEPGERTQVRVSGAYASSNEFVQRNTYDPRELNRTLQSNAAINHRFRSGGSLNFGASREQQIMAERVTTTLPSLSLTIPAITLASPTFGGAVQELTWNGITTNYSSTSEDRDEAESPTATDRDGRTQRAGFGTGFRFGNLRFTQGINGEDRSLDPKPAVPVDTTMTAELPGETTRSLNWNAALSYQQDLIASLRLTPQVSLGGQILESPRTGDEPVTSAATLNFGAALAADIFGFWPGVGPFERFRHKISPSVSYNFRPEPNQTPLQDSIFGATTRATNAIQLSFSQTFEGKRPAEEAADSAGDPASDDRATPATAGEPERRQTQQPVRLLSITTSAIAYDFEAASRGDEGLTTTSISNAIASDLLKNLSVNVSHSLFLPVPTGVVDGNRQFDLHLESLSARFGVTGESWLFRVLGLGGESEQTEPGEAALDTADTEMLIPEGDSRGLVPGAEPSTGMRGMGRVGGTGTWRADFDYSVRRPRDQTLEQNHQQVNATFAFQPTENWSVGWNTGYSISDSEFLNNSLTLSRALHRWQADFRILRAQNGNFSFEFEARLSDLPDLRVPYDQRSRGDRD